MIFTDEGGKTADKSSTDTNKCAKFPYTDTLNLKLIGPIFVCKSYRFIILPKKNTKGGQYGIIKHKEGNTPEESHLAYFDEGEYIKHHEF